MNTNKWIHKVPFKRVLTLTFALASFSLFAIESNPDSSKTGAEKLYIDHCQECHGVDRLGAMGPALLPENLARFRKNKAIKVINKGRAATQMPAFNQTLSEAEIASLADYIYTPSKASLEWTVANINASKVQHFDQSKLPNKAQFDADLMNLFIVVELSLIHI